MTNRVVGWLNTQAEDVMRIAVPFICGKVQLEHVL
jgi:hypothetical protein